jgi:hypothetical protein
MTEKMKLNLKALKVQSFVTSLADGEQDRLKGGRTGEPCVTHEYCSNPCPTVTCDQTDIYACACKTPV